MDNINDDYLPKLIDLKRKIGVSKLCYLLSVREMTMYRWLQSKHTPQLVHRKKIDELFMKLNIVQ